MTENEISYLIRGAAFKVQSRLGPGLKESVYEKYLLNELQKKNLNVKQQVKVIDPDDGKKYLFRIDLLVENKVIIEIKSVQCFSRVHFQQVLSYLRITRLKLGILINFNSSSLDKSSIRRIVNNL